MSDIPLHSMCHSYLPCFPTATAYQQPIHVDKQPSPHVPQTKPGKRSGPQRKLKNSEKERRRNSTLNTAFKWLLSQIPCIPKHSRVPKIKTLRLATSYIAYLTETLNSGTEADIGEFALIANAQLRQKNSYKAAVEAMQRTEEMSLVSNMTRVVNYLLRYRIPPTTRMHIEFWFGDGLALQASLVLTIPGFENLTLAIRSFEKFKC